MTGDQTLGDIGERRLVRDVLPKYCSPAGDDCAGFVAPSGSLVITTDPVPEPAAKVLGDDPDLYWLGWLLVTINCSDIAAAGAAPVVFVAAVEAPSFTKVRDFERLLRGIRDSCCQHGIEYVGGNLREATRLTATGTAVGAVRTGKPLSRLGAKPGDTVVSVGMGGIFWRDVLSMRRGIPVGKESSPLFRPIAQLRAMAALRSANVISAAIDNSDGLVPTLDQLARSNKLAIEIDVRRLRGNQPAGDDQAMDPARRWLGWGDWNVICTIPQDRLSDALALAGQNGHSILQIGRVLEPHPGCDLVTLVGERERLAAPRIESERFAKDSWFSAGVGAYIAMLESAVLPD